MIQIDFGLVWYESVFLRYVIYGGHFFIIFFAINEAPKNAHPLKLYLRQKQKAKFPGVMLISSLSMLCAIVEFSNTAVHASDTSVAVAPRPSVLHALVYNTARAIDVSFSKGAWKGVISNQTSPVEEWEHVYTIGTLTISLVNPHRFQNKKNNRTL